MSSRKRKVHRPKYGSRPPMQRAEKSYEPSEADGRMVGNEILKTVDAQLHAEELPEVKATYDRLRGMGFSDEEARRHIGAVVATEIYEMLKFNRLFDRKQYVARLERLPEMPWEE